MVVYDDAEGNERREELRRDDDELKRGVLEI